MFRKWRAARKQRKKEEQLKRMQEWVRAIIPRIGPFPLPGDFYKEF